MQRFKAVGITLAALILVGGGCANGTTDNTTTDSEQDQPSVQTTTQKGAASEKVNPGIMITKAEPLGNRTLLVEFEVTDEANEVAEGYRMILSNEEVPEWPTKGYWYQLGRSHTSKEWKGLPLGKRYLRVCVVEDDVCAAYSEVMEVEVK